MSESISIEVRFFLISVMWGAILLVMYDCLRIYRKVVRHGTIMLAVEDIIYWCISSLLIFRMMYQQNNGIIRGFALIGILLGMVLYKYSISDTLVKWISTLLIKIKKLFNKIIHIFLKPLKIIWKKFIKLAKYINKRYKKIEERVLFTTKKATNDTFRLLQSKRKRGKIKTDPMEEDSVDSRKKKRSSDRKKKEVKAKGKEKVKAKSRRKTEVKSTRDL